MLDPDLPLLGRLFISTVSLAWDAWHNQRRLLIKSFLPGLFWELEQTTRPLPSHFTPRDKDGSQDGSSNTQAEQKARLIFQRGMCDTYECLGHPCVHSQAVEAKGAWITEIGII